MQLDKSSPIPLYYQLKEALTRLIEEKYMPGDLLPTEPELERMFGVSRMTVRLAMGALVEEGLVSKQRGRGTFVQTPKIVHSLTSITSWTQQMKERGLTPKTVETEIARIEAPRKIAAMLGVAAAEPIVRVKRIRHANHEPMCIMINYIRESFVPGLLDSGLSQESLYTELMQGYGLHIVKAEETVEAREASEYEAEVLKIQPYSPVLFVTRLSSLAGEIPIEVVNVISRADRYKYQIVLYDSRG